ncbi:MAG TPA: methyl-accepting chemotaxis protein [Spirochaetota bacterium]|nr:methyl-accepting chemotaxis protein [Spirochaetota bacterium]
MIKSKCCLSLFFVFFICFSFFSENIFTSDNFFLKLDDFLILETDISNQKSLRDNNFEDENFLPYDGKHLPNEKDLKNRFYVLKTNFKIDKVFVNNDLSLYLSPFDIPFNIILNGKTFHKGGLYKNGTYNSAIALSTHILTSKDIMNFDGDNSLVIELFPQFEKNPLPELSISTYEYNSRKVFYKNIFAVHLVFAAQVLSFVLAFFYILLFFSTGMKDLKYIFFSLLCLSFSFGYINVGFIYDTSNFIFLQKVTRFFQIMCMGFLAIFVLEYSKVFPKKNNLMKIIVFIYGLICSSFVIFQSTKLGIEKAFNLATNIYFTPAMLFNIFILIFSLVKNKMKKTIPILAGVLIILFASVYDLIHLTSGSFPYCWLIPYSFLGLVLILFILLALEQSALYKESVVKAEEIDKKNKSLGFIIEKIVSVTGCNVDSAKKLDKNILKTAEIFSKYAQNSKDMGEKIISQLKNIDAIVERIGARLETSADKIPKAIQSQTAVVEETSATIANMDSNMDSITDASEKTNLYAKELAQMAEESKDIVIKSKKSIELISQNSLFLNNLLKSIEDISERTNLLSINASIESARAGIYGKGFAVVAQEIRKLSSKSSESLKTSFDNLNEMVKIISSSIKLSNEVAEILFEVIEKSKKSSEMVNEITNYIKSQKAESHAIMDGMKELLKESLFIKELSETDREENIGVSSSLGNIKSFFGEISQLISSQAQDEKTIASSIADIREVLEENKNNINALSDAVNFAKK